MKRHFSFFLLHYLLLFIASSIARFFFLLYNLKHLENNSIWEFLLCFYHSIPLDLSLLSYAFFPALFLFLIIRKDKKEGVLKIYFQVIATLIFSVNLIDTILFENWGTRINLMALFYSQNMGGAIASISIWNLVFFIFSLSIQLILFHYISKFFFKKANLFSSDNSVSFFKSIALYLVLISISIVLLRGGIGKVPINQSRVSYSANNYLNAASINGLWNFIYYIMNNKNSINYEDYRVVEDNELLEFSKTNIDAGKVLNPPFFSKNQKPNIILLVMESLSAETLTKLGGHFNWSQGLNKQVDNSLVFGNAYSSSNRTDKGLVSLISGFPALPTVSILSEPNRAAKLPSVSCDLSKMGYSNTFIYGGDIGFANMGFYLKSSCFSNLIDEKNISSTTAKGNWGFHDQDIFQELKIQINKTQHPFFITSLSLSVHEPFDIPTKEGLKNNLEQAYKYSDSCLTNFIEWFKKSESYKNTLLIITGDHGRELDIKNKFFFDKYKFHVPVVFMGDAINPTYRGKMINNLVSQTSILPFILQNMGIDVRNYEFYHNPINAKSYFVQYFFDNGTGFINNEDYFILTNPTGLISKYARDKTESDYDDLIHFSRTYQQLVMKKYFELNHN